MAARPDFHACDFDDVLIVGGGFSGTMLAIGLLRHEGPRATLIERAPARLGRGVAYGDGHAALLLNVRATNMSAYPNEPDDFTRWLAREAPEIEGQFVARDIYGRYLRDTLEREHARHPARLRLASGEVKGLAVDRRARAAFGDGTTVEADAAVLALGTLPPRPPVELAPVALAADIYVNDPWAPGALDALVGLEHVVLVGSGLTAVDVVLALDARGHGAPVTCLSRHGLRPRAHLFHQPPVAPRLDVPSGPLSRLLQETRARAAAIGWRGAVDELRPVTQRIWARAGLDERRRFLRHLRVFWDVHRHRVAPGAAARLEQLTGQGRVRWLAGHLAGYAGDLLWRPRGQDGLERLQADAVVNCTGHPGGISRTADAFIAGLQADGTIRPDALDLGIDADDYSRVIGADGQANPRLFCIGALTRGKYWEIVAVPDLRMQADRVARRLSNAHWVGGEGL